MQPYTGAQPYTGGQPGGVAAGGGGGAGGQVVYPGGRDPAAHDFTHDYNVWASKTVETLEDGNQNIVYTNFAGTPLLMVFKDVAGGLQWCTFYNYDSNGRLVMAAAPSAVTGYDESSPDLLQRHGSDYTYLSDHSGLIGLTDYYQSTTATATTAGGAAGYVQDVKLRQGDQGTPVLQ